MKGSCSITYRESYLYPNEDILKIKHKNINVQHLNSTVGRSISTRNMCQFSALLRRSSYISFWICRNYRFYRFRLHAFHLFYWLSLLQSFHELQNTLLIYTLWPFSDLGSQRSDRYEILECDSLTRHIPLPTSTYVHQKRMNPKLCSVLGKTSLQACLLCYVISRALL